MRRFWEKVDASGDCWEWTAAKNLQGYGKMKLPGGFQQAHRLSYELLVGPIPDGLVIDHLCRNRACVNPDHMEPVTMRENWSRGFSPSAKISRTNHCRCGHEYDRIYNGKRRCSACDRRRGKKRLKGGPMGRPKEFDVCVKINLTDELLEAIDAIASTERVSRSSLVRQLLSEALDARGMRT